MIYDNDNDDNFFKSLTNEIQMIDNYQLNLITPGNFRTFHDNLFQINIILMMISTNLTLMNQNIIFFNTDINMRL